MNKAKFNLFFLLILISFQGLSQSGINLKLLESKIKNGVDSVRKTKGLHNLINDSILYLASIDQGKYLESKKELTHYQNENQEKKTPQDRAEFYGAKNYQTGENIVLVSIDGSTEEQIANDMVKAWVNSPGHYANIINGDYDITGLAVNIDLKNNRIIAVQTFAAVNDFYAPSENKELFPYAPPLSLDTKMKYAKNLPKKHTKHAYGIT